MADQTSASYTEDVKTRYATERAIQNISEAVAHDLVWPVITDHLEDLEQACRDAIERL